MTVKELINILQQYNENERVRIYDEAHGIVDITDIFKGERIGGVIIS